MSRLNYGRLPGADVYFFPAAASLEPVLYLIVFTRGRLAPLVRKIPSLLPHAAFFLIAGLAVSLIWLQFESRGLRNRISELAGQVSGYERQLAMERDAIPAQDETRDMELLFDMRSPAATDTTAARMEEVAFPPDSGGFAIQLASLHNLEEARRVADGLKGSIPRSLLIQRAALASGQWFRVLIEPFPDKQRAAAFADSLRGGGAIRDYVLQRLPEVWQDDPDYEQVLN